MKLCHEAAFSDFRLALTMIYIFGMIYIHLPPREYLVSGRIDVQGSRDNIPSGITNERLMDVQQTIGQIVSIKKYIYK